MVENINNKNFSHFKLHTQYSICEGAIKIYELKNYCKNKKIKSIGISDTSNLCGALEFSEKISKQGTQPIIGTQIMFKYNGNEGLLTLIAKNEIGYRNILELSSKSYLENQDLQNPMCYFDDLIKFNEGIILMSGTIHGLIGKLFNKGNFQDIENIYKNLTSAFKSNFYIEIQRHSDHNEKSFENFNLNISHKLKIPIIASHEVFYIDKSMHDAHEALICIGNKCYLNDKSRLKYSDHHYLKSDKEMFDLFSDIPEALENNYNLPFRCNFRPENSNPILPNISSSKNNSADETLEKYSYEGLYKKFKNNYCKIDENPEDLEIYQNYLDRLKHELGIITKMKYSSYFLIVSDYINWAKLNDIPVGPGRGSAQVH